MKGNNCLNKKMAMFILKDDEALNIIAESISSMKETNNTKVLPYLVKMSKGNNFQDITYRQFKSYKLEEMFNHGVIGNDIRR